MRIGIDARAAAEEPAGRGTMVRQLLLALADLEAPHTFTLFARRPWEVPLPERFSWHLGTCPIHGGTCAPASRRTATATSSSRRTAT